MRGMILVVVLSGACSGYHVAPYQAGQGLATCNGVTKEMSTIARHRTAFGFASAMVAGALVIGGAAMGPDNSDGARWYEQNRNVLVAGAGGLLALLTKFEFDQSDSASDAASSAQGAMASGSAGDPDRAAYDTCVKAVAAYDESRKTTNADIAALASKQKDTDAKLSTVDAKAEDAQQAAKAAKSAFDTLRMRAPQ